MGAAKILLKKEIKEGHVSPFIKDWAGASLSNEIGCVICNLPNILNGQSMFGVYSMNGEDGREAAIPKVYISYVIDVDTSEVVWPAYR